MIEKRETKGWLVPQPRSVFENKIIKQKQNQGAVLR